MLYREPIMLPDGTFEVGRASCMTRMPASASRHLPNPSAIERLLQHERTSITIPAREFTRAASQFSPLPEGTPSMNVANAETLRTLFVGFQAAFQSGFGAAKPQWNKVAMEVPSTTLETEYGWLGLFPAMREWLGDRVINSLAISSYRIKNRDWEQTISVSRNNIEDDNLGIFRPVLEEMGRSAAELPDKLIFGLLALARTVAGYDGQYFFDVDHPVLDENGQAYSVANFHDAGPDAGPLWYLFDTSRAVKPLVYQNRRPPRFVPKDKDNDDNVFFRKEYLYGVDSRCNVGFGLWQLAYASNAPLTAESYEAARVAMTSLRGDYGHRLGIVPGLLVVPTTLEGPARRLLNTQLNSQITTFAAAGGDITVTGAGSNEWAGSAELVVTPYL